MEDHRDTVYINSKRKIIILHSRTVSKYFSNCDLVRLNFVLNAQAIIIKPVNKNISGAIVLGRRSKFTRILQPLLFFERYNINYPTGKYTSTWDEKKKQLTISPKNHIEGSCGGKFDNTVVYINLKQKTITLNSITTQIYFLNYNRVRVHYDASTKELAIQPITDMEDKLEYRTGFLSIQLRFLANAKSSVVRPYRVFSQNSIDHFDGYYRAEWDSEKNWLVINPENRIETRKQANKE